MTFYISYSTDVKYTNIASVINTTDIKSVYTDIPIFIAHDGVRWKDASQENSLMWKETFSFNGDNDAKMEKIELTKKML